ncbi:MAG: asparaginase [Ruminococcaceae bacterium]|nr:asparaginase [Oscillospiraceae bacterium]
MKKLLILGTGGTIACAKTEFGFAPSVSINELLKGQELPAVIHSEQLFELDSTNMTPRHWEKLARRIRERYDEFDGFIVTHGTDTMAYAAASLSCLIRNSRKPIVFTGSMKPMLSENSDAPKNLLGAVRYATDDRAFGVRIVFCGEIIDGRCAHKQNSAALDPFASVNNDELGYIEDNITFCEEYSGETRFYERLSDDVFLAKLIPGQRLYVPENTRALILESYGTGGVPDHLLGEVAELAGKGVYVIIATQCAYGGTNLSEYEVGQYASKVCPLLETGKMTVEYAVAKARWALAYSDNYEEFKRLYNAE